MPHAVVTVTSPYGRHVSEGSITVDRSDELDDMARLVIRGAGVEVVVNVAGADYEALGPSFRKRVGRARIRVAS